VVVSLDVQQDVVPVEKAELKCAGLCSCCDYTNYPDQNTDENDLSDDDGLLFEFDGDDTGFNGIFEEE
jgi:hypothetical protein